MKNINKQDAHPIRTWQRFAKNVRSQGCGLLTKLDDYSDPVLVSGCQRSGGTMLAKIITKSDGMVDFAWSKDDELDAALILSGYDNHTPRGRYCFQTTYLNECYNEYNQQTTNFKLIWLLRNPYSVVYSLLHNWDRFAFNELFNSCGIKLLTEQKRKWFSKFGPFTVDRVTRACLCYNNKITQILEIKAVLQQNTVKIIDYDELIINKEIMLPFLYAFINLQYNESYSDEIRSSSLNKSDRLSQRERKIINEICVPTYNNLKKLAQLPS